jgi:hypothetical protein
MSSEPAANRGRPADWCSVGAGRLGLAKRKACCGDDDVDELGVSIGQRVAAELVCSVKESSKDGKIVEG